MAIFNTNQNRQLYVVNKVVEEQPKAVGELQVVEIPNKNQVFFKHYGQGGLTRTDIIDIPNVCYAKITEADDLKRELKKATIKLNANINGGNLIAGQDYIVRIYINNYLAPGDDNVAIKYGAVHAYAGMTPEEFYKKLAKSLTMNFSREVQALLEFEADGSNGVIVKEVEQPWVLGTLAQESVNFSVVPTTVKWQADDVVWAETEDDGSIKLEGTGEFIGDGKKIADLEYFCHGERGDQYRNIGWPNVIPTKYMVDATKDYDVLDMHYFFSDTGVNNQKSEKDITFVSSEGALEDIKSKLEDLEIKFEEKA